MKMFTGLSKKERKKKPVMGISKSQRTFTVILWPLFIFLENV